MLFSKKRTPPVGSAAAASVQQITTKRRGDAAEALAAEYLTARGLRLLQRCRFDVVLVQGVSKADDIPTIEWLQSAFDAS